MSRSSCGRADLVRILSAANAPMSFAAELLGYSKAVQVQARPAAVRRTVGQAQAGSSIGSEPAAAPPGDVDWPRTQLPLSFWRAGRFEQRKQLEEPLGEPGELIWRARPSEPARTRPIAQWRETMPRLRAELARPAHSQRVDVAEAVRRLATGRLFEEMPREVVRRWGDRLLVVVDRSERLKPFHQDQADFLANLANHLPRSAIQLAVFNESLGQIRLRARRAKLRPYQHPEPHVPIVVLGDLGALSAESGQTEFWKDWAARLVQHDGRAVAVVPCAPRRIPAQIRNSIRIVSWQKLSTAMSCTDAALRRKLVDLLFQCLSPSRRVEPGLLRDVRHCVPGANDASLEADFWQDPRVASPHSTAATLDPAQLPRFAELPQELRGCVLQAFRRWRTIVGSEIFMSEIWGLDTVSLALLPPSDREDARRWQAALAERDESEYTIAELAWLARATSDLSDEALARQKHLRVLHRRAHGHAKLLGGDPQELPQKSELQVAVGQIGDSLVLKPDSSANAIGRPFHTFGALRSLTHSIVVNENTRTTDRNAFWKLGAPPEWASDWGRDEFGAWVTFRVPKHHLESLDSEDVSEFVVQRMRWIPLGRFMMGSPEDEEGRWPDEGSQREVTLTHGCWLFDTPVTQRMWVAVMGSNPSRFKGDKRPVENVSWDDAQEFMKELCASVPRLTLQLPTEALWEYACRAGTTTRYAFGNELSKNQANFEGNTTTDVAIYQPNALGLFDIHGNVWEWCQDWYSDDYYREGPAVDPTGPPGGHARVLRGGCWRNALARFVRSAFRSFDDPGLRTGGIGFRCALVQAAAEPAAEATQATESRAQPTEGGEAVALRIDSDAAQSIGIPKAVSLIIKSDLDALTLERIGKPHWASAIGRDRYGLWAEFKLGKPPVVQRMRWIPPGRFMMGSPKDEEGRYEDEGLQCEVTLTHGYWLFDTPVAQGLWLALMADNRSKFQDDSRPVDSISWEDAQQFLAALNSELDEANFALPTEAEWEYACRAGTTTRYAFGDELTSEQARFNVGYDEGTASVGTYAPNNWGLFDMHGNVWEWCNDWWSGDYYKEGPLIDPTGPTDGRNRVLRGGSWRYVARFVRSASRLFDFPGRRLAGLGFRCALVQASSRQASETSEGAG